MALKSFILSKLDHQMSKSWKQMVAHKLQTNSKFDLLKIWLLGSGQDFGKKFLDSKHVLKVYLKPSRKNPKILFLPLCSLLVRLNILHLSKKFALPDPKPCSNWKTSVSLFVSQIFEFLILDTTDLTKKTELTMKHEWLIELALKMSLKSFESFSKVYRHLKNPPK